jgi:hypothetical protein
MLKHIGVWNVLLFEGTVVDEKVKGNVGRKCVL